MRSLDVRLKRNRQHKFLYTLKKKHFMHFSGLFKDILIKEEVTADGLTASTMV